jgi:thiol-disulfide isomerase/thioredoxin
VAQQVKPVLIVFTAAWCPYCRQIKPAVDELMAEGFDIRVVDTDAQQVPGTNLSGKQMLAQYGTEFIPAFYVSVPGRAKPVKLNDTKPTLAKLRTFLAQAGMKPIDPNEGIPVPPAPRAPGPEKPIR